MLPPNANGEAAVLAAGAGAAELPPNEKGDAAAVGLAGSWADLPNENTPPACALEDEFDPNVLEDVEAAAAPPKLNTEDDAEPNPPPVVVVAAGAPNGLDAWVVAGAGLAENENDGLGGSELGAPNMEL